MDITIAAASDQAKQPTIIIGFSSPEFSQAVTLPVSVDPLKVVAFADNIYKGIVDAAAEAVKAHKAVTGTFKGDKK